MPKLLSDLFITPRRKKNTNLEINSRLLFLRQWSEHSVLLTQ